MRESVQNSFGGGINLFHDDFRLGDTEYGTAFNVRNRRGSLRTIKAPVEVDLTYRFVADGVTYNASIIGIKQGCYGFGEYLLLFAGGRAYYRHFRDIIWICIDNFQMSPIATYIYVKDVPATNTNFNRVLQTANIINGTSADTRVDLQSNLLITGTPSGLVVQDGVNQPFFISINDSGSVIARRLNTYAQWTMNNREYVPIGLNMDVVDGILFIVSPDRKTIYRSVSGRMLDFVVNVTITGDKGGDATTTSYAVSALSITALRRIKSGQLLIGTNDGCFPITLNYDRTIFGEPTFRNNDSFAAGIVNQFSIVETLNDYTFIDKDGIRSFNDVRVLGEEGRSGMLSKYIHPVIDGLQQTNVCACTFQNYALYQVLSSYGYVVLVYDMLSDKWVSIDNYNLQPLKMFTVVNSANGPILYAITQDNVYQLFGSPNSLTSKVTLRQYVSDRARSQLKLDKLRLIFDDVDASLTIVASEISDNRINAVLSRTIILAPNPPHYPLNFPIYYNLTDNNRNAVFNFQKHSKIGTKVGITVEWNGTSALMHCEFGMTEHLDQVPLKQRASV